MRSGYAYRVAGIAIVALVVTVGRHFLGSLPSQSLPQMTSPTVESNARQKESARTDHEGVLLSQQQLIEAKNGQGQRRDTVLTLPNRSRTDPSVIGRPFALSVSMQGELKKSEVFRAARERLEQMAREPRDNEWASLKESQIQDLMMSNGTYIRNIECRTATCAVEVAPASDPFDVTTTEQQLKNIDLWGPEYLTFANETDDSGNKIKVALFEILRR
jgi:hypothetical protein